MKDLIRQAASSAFLTDHYELTMLQAALRSETAGRPSLFEAFGRSLPAGRRYGVLAGTGRFLELLADFHFSGEQLDFLRRTAVVDEATIDYLAEFEFSGTIRGYAEGEIYFPGSPLVTVESTFAEAVVLETLLLSTLNYDSAVASAASRITYAAGNRPCADMGSRRTHEQAAVAAARAAVIGGFTSTSNLQAGLRYGLKTIGTSAHSFTLLHDDERAAFAAQIDALGIDTTVLIDTYDIEQAVRTAVEVAGPGLGGVRIDSGDLAMQAGEVRALLDELGAVNTTITVTSDLDEYAIAGLRAAPVDSYGVGTKLVTGSGAPTAALVYKLVSRRDGESGEWVSVAKRSAHKESHGGFKQAVRNFDGTIATEESIGVPALPDSATTGRPLTVDLVVDGVIDESYTGVEGVRRARARHAASLGELPPRAHSLQPGEPALPTVYYQA
ncbi:nicotinate phosphoribosyltransferase [Brevibacterium moorei]|uniref:nicotinate phosphoribosyltransferase n=1 Tax=Brevibacterium moorei TaxID=2968457 RepID=UPI00211CBD5C|nr:nicotinate phosphoribosyltransferase [Brevibacterium sp. 68QC2CO]MCQ9386859.1 nicotinate phosphoribosyltransferase [Brevibacterium sp. 68QC2CO]